MKDPGSAHAISELERLGALSSRLAHSLSNHLAIITGNLFLAASLNDPDKTATLLQTALQAGNEAGALLSRFADARRAASVQSGFCPVPELIAHLQGWAHHNHWEFQLDPAIQNFSNSAINGSWPWLAFALNAIATETDLRDPRLHLTSRAAPSQNSRNPWATHATAALDLTIAYHSTVLFDWDQVRVGFSHWNLIAATELLNQMGALPESLPPRGTLQSIRLSFPISATHSSGASPH